MAAVTSRRARSGPASVIPGADQVSWYFLRVSGVLLIVFALGHILFTHYLHVPSDTTFNFVAGRWANPLWRTFDWILLLLALWHGLIGLRISVTDFIRSEGWQVVGQSVVWVLGLLWTALGTITIFTFDAAAARNNTGPLSGDTWIADVIGAFLFLVAIGVYVGVIAVIVWVVRSLRRGGPPIYAGDTGQYAWILQKATGLGVLFFLLVHIVDIMLIGLGRDVYDKSVAFYSNGFLVPMEIALVGALLYHSLNGLRIIILDFSDVGIRRERQLFWAALICAAIITLPSAILIIASEF